MDCEEVQILSKTVNQASKDQCCSPSDCEAFGHFQASNDLCHLALKWRQQLTETLRFSASQ